MMTLHENKPLFRLMTRRLSLHTIHAAAIPPCPKCRYSFECLYRLVHVGLKSENKLGLSEEGVRTGKVQGLFGSPDSASSVRSPKIVSSTLNPKPQTLNP